MSLRGVHALDSTDSIDIPEPRISRYPFVTTHRVMRSISGPGALTPSKFYCIVNCVETP